MYTVCSNVGFTNKKMILSIWQSQVKW